MKQHVLFWIGVRSENESLQKKHGNFKYLDISKHCWQWWCKKHNVIFYEYNTPSELDTEAHRATWTRWFDVFDQLDAAGIDYDKIAVIDGSSLVRWDTPNFFELTDDRLTAFRSLENVKWIYESVQGYQDLFPDVKFDLSKYISCGFQIFAPHHKAFLKDLKKFYYENYDVLMQKQKHTVKKGTDQPVYNYFLQLHDMSVNTDLSPAFMLTHLNRFDWLSHNWQLREDGTPFFIKYGYIWFYSGFPNRADREMLMKQTWDIIKENYK
jgi:hypothetical protein